MFELTTPRLRIRTMRPADAEALAGYRNLPEVAAMQTWDLPYTEQDALALLSGQADLDGPTLDEWVQFAVEHDGEVIGDVVCNVRGGGGVAEIGYTLHPRWQGRGYATEASAALVEYLVETTGVQRIEASLDVDNVASMRVLEAVGLTFECVAAKGFLWRGEWVADLRYAMTDEQWRAWVQRPTTPPAAIEFVEMTDDDAYLFGRLRTHHSQERFVSPMAHSFRDALFPEVVDGAAVVPWLRGVTADGERVGFVMIAAVTDAHPDPYLWRLLVDRMHQRRGIGRMILDTLTDQLRAQGATTLVTSWVDGPGSPRPFYERYGFAATGRIIDGETEGAMAL